MEKSIVVSIKKEKGFVRVSNDQGQEWEIPCHGKVEGDTSTTAAVAVVANAMLTGTIASQIRYLDSDVLVYKLTLIYK